MSSAEEIIGKLIDEHIISGKEAIILLKAIYGRENSDQANQPSVVGQTIEVPTWPSDKIDAIDAIDANEQITVLY